MGTDRTVVRLLQILIFCVLVVPASGSNKGGNKPGAGGGGAGGGGKNTSPVLIGHLVPHANAFAPSDSVLLSRCGGDVSKGYAIVWPRHDRCVGSASYDASGNLLVEYTGVHPDGFIGREGKILCNPDELCDDPSLSVTKKRGRIESVQLFIQDDMGDGGVQYESEVVRLDQPVAADSCGFVIHVHEDAVPVWELSGHTGGGTVGIAGYIGIGDVVYQPETPCN